MLCNLLIFVKTWEKKPWMMSKTIGAEVWTLFLPPTWPEVSQIRGVGQQLCRTSQQHPHSTSNSSENSHPTDQPGKWIPPAIPNLKSHLCQVELGTHSHFLSWQLPLSLAKWCSHHNRLKSFVRSLLPQTHSQQSIQRSKFKMILQSQNQKSCWLL